MKTLLEIKNLLAEMKISTEYLEDISKKISQIEQKGKGMENWSEETRTSHRGANQGRGRPGLTAQAPGLS